MDQEVYVPQNWFDHDVTGGCSVLSIELHNKSNFSLLCAYISCMYINLADPRKDWLCQPGNFWYKEINFWY